MPRYVYDDPFPRRFPLQIGPDFVVEPGDDRTAQPDGSQVELHPGDHLVTTEPYDHPLLTEATTTTPAPVPDPAPVPRVPRQRTTPTTD